MSLPNNFVSVCLDSSSGCSFTQYADPGFVGPTQWVLMCDPSDPNAAIDAAFIPALVSTIQPTDQIEAVNSFDFGPRCVGPNTVALGSSLGSSGGSSGGFNIPSLSLDDAATIGAAAVGLWALAFVFAVMIRQVSDSG